MGSSLKTEEGKRAEEAAVTIQKHVKGNLTRNKVDFEKQGNAQHLSAKKAIKSEGQYYFIAVSLSGPGKWKVSLYNASDNSKPL